MSEAGHYPVQDTAPRDTDPTRYEIGSFTERGFRQAYAHVGRGGLPLLLIHGWPETKRLYWRVIEPLAAAGFEVIVPDLRGYGDSDIGPDGKHDAPASSRDLHALVTEGLAHTSVIVAGGDFGGVVAQDLAARFPGFVDRLVLTNCPLPFEPTAMAELRTRGSVESLDYYRRQGTDADALIDELDTPARRRRYIESFYTTRFWAHPGAFTKRLDARARFLDLDFHCEPFDEADRLRATWGAYEARFDPAARSEPTLMPIGGDTRTMVLYGPSDQVVAPDFDRMAGVVFPNHVGPFLLRDCGHFVAWEAAEAFASAVIMFCSDLLAASNASRHGPPSSTASATLA